MNVNRRDLLKSFVALCSIPARLLRCFPAPVPRVKEVVESRYIGIPTDQKFALEGLPLPIVHKDFEVGLHSLADCARARGLDEKTIREIEEYEQGLKRYLVLNDIQYKAASEVLTP